MAEEETQQKTDDYDKEAYVRHLCEGLNGKGCGTEPKTLSKWRKAKTWEERRQAFLERQGD